MTTITNKQTKTETETFTLAVPIKFETLCPVPYVLPISLYIKTYQRISLVKNGDLFEPHPVLMESADIFQNDPIVVKCACGLIAMVDTIEARDWFAVCGLTKKRFSLTRSQLEDKVRNFVDALYTEYAE